MAPQCGAPTLFDLPCVSDFRLKIAEMPVLQGIAVGLKRFADIGKAFRQNRNLLAGHNFSHSGHFACRQKKGTIWSQNLIRLNANLIPASWHSAAPDFN